MPYVTKKRRRYRIWERVRVYVFIGTGMLAVGGLWWWLTSLGPRGGTVTDGGPVVVSDAALEAKREQVTALLDEAMALRPGGDPARLAQARDLQEEVVAAAGSAGQGEVRRLAEIERRLADAKAQALDARIVAARQAGEQAVADGRFDEAAVRLQEALEWQREINRSAAGASTKNFVRESRLELALQELAAAPLAAEVDSALAVARAAAEEEDWARALPAYAVAREGQARLNAEYSKTKYADTLRLGRIDQEVASLDAAEVARAVDEEEAAGDAALAAGDTAAATAAYAAARQLQEQVNEEYARSRFLSSARVEALEVKRQTAASVPRLEQLREAEQAITRHLKQREVVAAMALIEDAEGRIAALQELLPKSEQMDAGLRLKLAYLAAQRERLAEVQDAVFDRLRPLPGVGELWLLQTEVPQALYRQVMKTNPSRNPGRAFPVDSVSWFDAQQFCERLGWILGRRVRLPREAEFRIAVGGGEAARAAAAAATESGDRAEAQSREMAVGQPNAAGFFDLVGNLAEWLDAPAGENGRDPAPVAGGSYLDSAAVLATVPVVERPRADRARHVGFRVVVEMESVP